MNINFVKNQSDHKSELNGFIKVKNEFDSFKIKEIYNYNKKSFDVSGFVDLTNSKVKVSRLNYNKDSGEKSEAKFDINFVLNKYYNISNLNFLADKNNHLTASENFS